MRKPNSNAKALQLSPAQREKLSAWIVDENMSYEDAAKRATEEFKTPISVKSVRTFYQIASQQAMLDRIVSSRKKANEVVAKFKENPADIYNALLETAGQIAFDKATEGKGELDAETIFNFTKLVMNGRKQAMDAETLALAKDRFQFDAASACLKHLPTLRAIASKQGVDNKEKINQIRLALFGAAPE